MPAMAPLGGQVVGVLLTPLMRLAYTPKLSRRFCSALAESATALAVAAWAVAAAAWAVSAVVLAASALVFASPAFALALSAAVLMAALAAAASATAFFNSASVVRLSSCADTPPFLITSLIWAKPTFFP